MQLDGGNNHINIQSSVYWVPEVTGLESSTYGTQKNLINMFSQSEFSGWNFNTIWQIDEGESMPYLRGLPKPDGVNRNSFN